MPAAVDLLADSTEPTAAALSWAEYGIIGLVMFFLCGCFAFCGKWMLKHVDTQQAAHREDRKEWRREHLEERKEWIEAHRETKEVIEELKEVVAKIVPAG